MWESTKENRACCLFSAVSAPAPNRLSLYTPFHVSTSSVSADRSDRLGNPSGIRTSESGRSWIYKPLTHRINVENPDQTNATWQCFD